MSKNKLSKSNLHFAKTVKRRTSGKKGVNKNFAKLT